MQTFGNGRHGPIGAGANAIAANHVVAIAASNVSAANTAITLLDDVAIDEYKNTTAGHPLFIAGARKWMAWPLSVKLIEYTEFNSVVIFFEEYYAAPL